MMPCSILFYYPKIGPGYVGATLASCCYTMSIESTTGLCMIHTSMKQLLCLEFKLSQGTFVLETLVTNLA